MVTGRLGSGETITFEGRQWVFLGTSRGPKGIYFTLDDGDEVRRVPYLEIAWQSLSCVPEEAGESDHAVAEMPELAELDPITQERILQRYADLMEMAGKESAQRTPRDARYDPALPLRVRIEAKSKELQARGEKSSSAKTLYRQLKGVEREGLAGLIHGNRSSVDHRLADLDPDLMEAARRFCSRQKKRAKVSNKRLLVSLQADLESQGFDVSDLSRYKLKQVLGHASRGRGLHLDARSRRTHSNRPFAVYRQRVVSGPGEVVQIDATTTTIHVWDPVRGWARATILSAIDVYSRCVCALRVVVGDITTRDLALLLWDIGKPVVARAGHPYDLNAWHGVPQNAVLQVVREPGAEVGDVEAIGPKPAMRPATIVLDHGSENDSRHLFAVAARVGIDIVFCPPRKPHPKGIVETWHNTLREIQSTLPGYKGESPTNHPAGAEQTAGLQANDLHDVIWEHVIDVYHQGPHRGLRDSSGREFQMSPMAAFEAFLAQGGSLRVPEDPYRYIEFLSTVQCTVNDYGLNVDKRIYNSPAVLEMRQHMQGGVGVAASTLTVYFDRLDVSVVFARHPLSREWVVIPRVDPDGKTVAPYSELVSQEVMRRAGRDVLTPDQAHRLEVELAKQWNEARVTDIRDQRLAAVERGRSANLGLDRIESPVAMRRLLAEVQPPEPPIDDGEVYTDDEAGMVDDLDNDVAADEGGWGQLGEASPW